MPNPGLNSRAITKNLTVLEKPHLSTEDYPNPGESNRQKKVSQTLPQDAEISNKSIQIPHFTASDTFGRRKRLHESNLTFTIIELIVMHIHKNQHTR